MVSGGSLSQMHPCAEERRGLTFVDVREVGTEPIDGVQHGRAVGSVQRFDGFGIQVFDRLLVAPAHAVAGACVAVEGIDGLCDAHL